jgi:8-oxo-dGTP diphosphatase
MNSKRFKMPVAVHLFLINGSKILLLRRYNTGYQDGNYSVIAGHLDGNEEVKTAMIREAEEEAGISISLEDLEVVGVMHRKSGHDERIDFFLTANKWNGTIKNMERNKCDGLLWVEMNDLPDNVIPYIRKAISNYQEKKHFDDFGWTEK